MDHSKLQSVLEILGQKSPANSELILLGGSALILLGSSRQTIDIDFLGDDVSPNSFHQSILEMAKELKVIMEAVPLERFIPLPEGHEERNIFIRNFNNLRITVADPYSIALSKLDRGLDSDMEDILFLIKNSFININDLEKMTNKALQRSREFDLNVDQILSLLQDVKENFK